MTAGPDRMAALRALRDARGPRVPRIAPVPRPARRAVCPRCTRPATVCYCAALPRIDTRTRIVVLQHPRESRVPIGTARMATLALPNSEIHVGVAWDGRPEIAHALSDPSRPAVLLYPGAGARDVLRDPPAGPVTLVVVDGTWSQARSIVRDNPLLAALPRYAFTAPEPSHYRIRREPRDDYVSTIEALMHVLGALEGDPERFRALLRPFRAMVDAHLERQRAIGRRQPFRRRPREGAAREPLVPPAVYGRADDLVCVIGESNAWPHGTPERALGDEIVRWTALRPSTGEMFDAVVAPTRPLAPGVCARTGLAPERIRAGSTAAEMVAAFERFLRPGDVVCAWGPYSPRLYLSAGGRLPAERVDLRVAARRLVRGHGRRRRDDAGPPRGHRRFLGSRTHRDAPDALHGAFAATPPGGDAPSGRAPAAPFDAAGPGTLEEYAARVAAPVPPPEADGRAIRRVRLLAAILAAWRAAPASFGGDAP